MTNTPVLHLLCGHAGAGKSTLAAWLAASPATVLVAQDHWMAHLYPDELRSVADYLRYVLRLRAAMEPHLADLLRAGLSVVLDWPANTVAARAWMRATAEATGAAHRLHWVDTPDELCLQRLDARNRSGAHPYHVTPAQFAELKGLCEPPTAAEGLTIERYSASRCAAT